MNKPDCSFFFRKFKDDLAEALGPHAESSWEEAGLRYDALAAAHSGLDRDSAMFILPAAALYQADPATLPLVRVYAIKLGQRMGRMVHGVTSIPGVPELLWRHMSRLMRSMSSLTKGYQRRIEYTRTTAIGEGDAVCDYRLR